MPNSSLRRKYDGTPSGASGSSLGLHCFDETRCGCTFQHNCGSALVQQARYQAYELLPNGGADLSAVMTVQNLLELVAQIRIMVVAMNNRSVPTATVLPHLVYRNVSDACEWLTRVFGFTEYFRHGQPVSGIQMHLGDAYIMLSTPREGRSESPAKLGYGTQMLTMVVADVEAHYAKTKREGGTIWEELHETIYGERQYGATDLEGHRWLFSQHARDVSPDTWGATIVPPRS